MRSLLLALGLAMDSFALSLSIASFEKGKKNIMLKVMTIFMICQAGFFTIGLLIGDLLTSYFPNVLKYISFILLFIVAVNFLVEAIKKDDDEIMELSTSKIIFIGILTSIDALMCGAAAISFEYTSYIFTIAVVAIVTFIMTGLGFAIFNKIKKIEIIEKNSLIIGSVILFILAFEMLLK